MLMARAFLFFYNPDMTRTARVGFALLVFASLAYLPGAFTHDDVPKRFCVSLAAVLLMVAWLAPSWRAGVLEIRRDRVLLPFLLAWGAALVSFLACVIRGANPYEAFWPLFLQACGVLVYLVVSSIPGDDRFLRERLPRWVVGAACVVAIYGLLQRAGIDPLNPAWANPDREPGSTLGGKTFAGEYQALVFPLALALALTAASWTGRAAAAGAVLLIGSHLLVTGARGAWLGAAAGTALLLFLGLLKRTGPERHRVIPPRMAGLVAGAALAVAVLLQVSGAVDWVGRVRNAVAPPPGHDTGLVRRELWKSTLRMAADHPVLGVGPGQYDLNIQPYRSVAEMRESDPQRLGRSAGMAHNDFLQHLAETGCFGAALVVLVLYALVRKSAAHLRGQEDPGAFLLTAGLLGGALAAAGAGLAGNALHQPAVGALAMLFLGMAERIGNPAPQPNGIPMARGTRVISMLPAGILGGALMIGLLRTGMDVAYGRYLAARRAVPPRSGAEAIGVVTWRARLDAGCLNIPGMDRWEIRRSLGLSYLESSLPEDRETAVLHIARAKALNPNDPETWNAWGLLCRRQDRRDECRSTFERAVHLDPIVRQPRLNLAMAYEQDGMPDKAAVQYRALLGFDPKDADAHFGLGVALARLDRHAEAARAFANAEASGYRRGPGDARSAVRQLDALRAFRESDAGRAWLGERDRNE
jgi:hypothetical protein